MLEELIKNHKDLADFRDPPKGHDRRFLKKIVFSTTRKRELHYYLQAMLATSIFVAAIISSIIISGNQKQLVADMPREIAEAIYYYDNISNQIFKTISVLKVNERSEFNIIKDDIELFEKWQKSIMSDYKKFPDDERVQNAVIEFHKNKAEMLSDIYELLNNQDYKTI